MNAIVNAKIIVPNDAEKFLVVDNSVLLYEQRVHKIVPQADWQTDLANEIIDARGAYLAPGFINVHIHGCNGCDTMDENNHALADMASFLPRTGVTAFLPTTMTEPPEKIAAALARVRQSMLAPPNGATILGAHMEGPYISPKYAGAQNPADIRRADLAEIAPFADVIKILTIAPEELPPDKAARFVHNCQTNGIVVSLGHTAADYDTAMKFIDEYHVTHITHTYNAMSPFLNRTPGTVGAALDSTAYCEVIADLIHVSPAALRLLYRAKGAGKIILVTDSLRSAGLGDGKGELGGQIYEVKHGAARLADGTLAGSVATMNECVKNFMDVTGAPLPEVIAMATQNPARELGLYNDYGSIEVGKRADFVLFDDELNILATIINGKKIYEE